MHLLEDGSGALVFLLFNVYAMEVGRLVKKQGDCLQLFLRSGSACPHPNCGDADAVTWDTVGAEVCFT